MWVDFKIDWFSECPSTLRLVVSWGTVVLVEKLTQNLLSSFRGIPSLLLGANTSALEPLPEVPRQDVYMPRLAFAQLNQHKKKGRNSHLVHLSAAVLLTPARLCSSALRRSTFLFSTRRYTQGGTSIIKRPF